MKNFLLIISLFLFGCFTTPTLEHIEGDKLVLTQSIDLKNYGEKSLFHRLKHILVGSCKSPKIIEVGGIVEGPKGQLLVADNKTQTLYQFSLESQSCGNFNQKYLKGTESIADIIFHSENYFVLDNKLKHIFILDVNLNRIETLLLDSAKSPQKLMTLNNSLYVIDPPKNQVILVDLDSKNQTIFKGNETTKLWLPQDFTKSSDDHIFILNELGRHILVTDSTGSTLHDIQLSFRNLSLLFPKTIQYHANGFLLIHDAGIQDIIFIKPDGELITTILSEFDTQKVYPSDFTILHDNSIAVVDRVNQSINILRFE